MDIKEKVRNLLISFYEKDADKSVTTKEIIQILNIGGMRREVNQFLYNSDLNLDRIYELCKKESSNSKSAPSWYIRKKKFNFDYDPITRFAWEFFELIEDGEERIVSSLSQYIQQKLNEFGLKNVIDKIDARILYPEEKIEWTETQSDETDEKTGSSVPIMKIRFVNNRPILAGHVLDCEEITQGNVGILHYIRLGMAIQECVSNYSKNEEIVLKTKQEHLYKALRSLIETTPALQTYKISVDMTETPLITRFLRDSPDPYIPLSSLSTDILDMKSDVKNESDV